MEDIFVALPRLCITNVISVWSLNSNNFVQLLLNAGKSYILWNVYKCQTLSNFFTNFIRARSILSINLHNSSWLSWFTLENIVVVTDKYFIEILVNYHALDFLRYMIFSITYSILVFYMFINLMKYRYWHN